jgi:hypothetical protein
MRGIAFDPGPIVGHTSIKSADAEIEGGNGSVARNSTERIHHWYIGTR